MKKLLLTMFMAMFVAVSFLSAKTLYLDPGTWDYDSPVYGVHAWGDGSDYDAIMTKVEGEEKLYQVEIADSKTSIIFVRLKTGTTEFSWDAKWNQTGDLAIGTNNKLTITGWGNNDNKWSTYTPPTPDPEPEPDPTPDPEPEPDPTPDPEPEPDPTPDPEPEPDPTPDPEPEPDPTPDPEPEPDPTPDPEPEPDPTPDPEPSNTITISFASDWATANFYAWNTGGDLTAAWPGNAMTKADGKFTYELTLPEGAYSFVINNGNGTQTVDTEGVAESTCFALDASVQGKWTLKVSADCEAGEVKPIETSYVLMGVNGDWKTGIAMTPNPGNADEYVVMGQAISATDAVKVVVFSAEGTIYCGTVKDGSATVTYDDMGNIMLAAGTYDFYYSISENAIYIGASSTPDPDPTPDPEPDPTPDPEPDPTPDPEPEPDPTPDPEPEPDPTPDPEPEPDPTPDPEPAKTITIRVAAPWDECYLWAWNDSGNLFDAWPGAAMVKGVDGFYSLDIEINGPIYIIATASSSGPQTNDYKEGVTESTCFNVEDGNLVVNYDCKYDGPSTDVEEASAELIYAIDGTIYAPVPFAIIDLAGKDVTNANGALNGAYIVKTQNSVTKVLVK